MPQSATNPAVKTGGRALQYLRNVIWVWTGAITNLVIGIFLTPIIIRKLGPAGYGVWATVYSLVGYYGFLDLGFRPAVIRFCAYYKATNQIDRINQILNTVLLYYTLGSLLLLGVAGVVVWNRDYLFPQIEPGFRSDFSFLVMLTAGSW